MKKISVCMATYNGAKYISEQLDSILMQLGENDEVIVSDDGSSDDTIKIIKKYADPRIRLVYNTEKHGYTKNFENALKYACGDIIFLSDQDDIWLDNKVKLVVNCLNEYDFVIHDCKVTDSKLNVKYESFFEWMGVKKGFLNQFIRMRYLGCCMAFNKNLYEKILPFPPNDKLVEHDAWIGSVAEAYVKCKKMDIPLILYRRHSMNTSEAGEGKGYPLWNKICRRVYRLYYILKVR